MTHNFASARDEGERRVIITGADSTARTIAERFADAGARVAVCDVREEAVSSLVESRRSIFGMRANMGVEEDVERFIAAATERLGGVDFLLNVVGISGPSKPTEEVTTAEWRDTLAVNLTGMFLSARAVIPALKAQRFGGLVNISTASTRTGLPNRTPYIVSKYGVEGLTRNLARELGPFNIRCNAILPGGINNERARMVLTRVAKARGVTVEQATADAISHVSMRTLVEPEDIAEMAFFLCSDGAPHVTGQLIGVCGNHEWEE